MSVYFTSDLHLGHERVAALRGFDVATHDDMIAGSWTATVKDNDDVWVLGDVSMDSRQSVEHALGILALLPGRKHLIAGNHDRVHPWRRDAHKWQRVYLTVFDSVASTARRKVAGESVLLSHFPYHRDHTDHPRYDQWRLKNEGLWLLHGHTHGQERVTYRVGEWSDTGDLGFPLVARHRLPDVREIHVGWDAWGSLVPLETVETLIRNAEKEAA